MEFDLMEGITYHLPFLNRMIDDVGTYNVIWTVNGTRLHIKQGCSMKDYLKSKDIKPDK